MRRVGVPLFLLVSLAACGSDRVALPPAAASSSTSAPAAQSTSAPAVVDGIDSAAAPPESAAPTTTLQADAAVAPSSLGSTPSSLGQDCRLVADLDDAEELLRWQVVNDGVMGGRSNAEADVADSILVLTGEIVTDGGGFSSARLGLDEPLGEVTSLLLRVRTDGRPYELTVADAAPGRDRRISHQGPIAAIGGEEWEEVAVDLNDLEASVFGRPVEVDPFEPSAAVEVGIILADGSDGPFRFELDWIRACP